MSAALRIQKKNDSPFSHRFHSAVHPLVTAFFPIGMLYFCPLLDIKMDFYSNVISILLSLQMLLDACVTFTVIKDYRKALMRIFFSEISSTHSSERTESSWTTAITLCRNPIRILSHRETVNYNSNWARSLFPLSKLQKRSGQEL